MPFQRSRKHHELRTALFSSRTAGMKERHFKPLSISPKVLASPCIQKTWVRACSESIRELFNTYIICLTSGRQNDRYARSPAAFHHNGDGQNRCAIPFAPEVERLAPRSRLHLVDAKERQQKNQQTCARHDCLALLNEVESTIAQQRTFDQNV